ncbi:exopolyphosphatase (PRUNE) [Vairimorpha necatrix]|uniref:Exopolyphosphatase (PRUNE) n=1 Tax=Vairimorpha necatrix TaxID=6039 RepID=A0AAX4JCB2_9MICR
MTELKESLEKFLLKNKNKVQNSHLQICMGNEACDLDSFISSLILAHAINAIFVVNMRKDVFKSKGELIWVCEKYEINIEDLIFLERPLGTFSKEAKAIGTYLLVDDKKIFITDKSIKLILTDHNEPIDELKHCEIEMIIDHHPLTHKISNTNKIYIDTDVGSATTLVSRYLGNDLSKKATIVTKKLKKNKNQLCTQIASLLLIPIIVDTKFLKRRVSTYDIEEYKKLKKLSHLSKKELKNELKNIKKARRNDQYHNTNIILLKDYKSYNSCGYNFGMSVIKYKFEKWIDREAEIIRGFEQNKEGLGLFCKLQSFKNDMGLDFYLVSTKIKNVRTVIILDYPFIKSLADDVGLIRNEYKGMVYYKIEVGVTRKISIPKIIELLKKHDNLINE